MKPIKSTSMRSLYRKCPRQIFFRYVAAIQLKERVGPRLIGSCYHSGLESMRIDRDWKPAVASAIAAFDLASDSQTCDIEKMKIVTYLKGYWHKFIGDYGHSKILTEQMVATDDEVCYIDAALVNDDGSIIIIEDKTTALFNASTEDSLKMNEQLLNYMYLCNLNGIKVAGLKYRETLKSSHKPGRKETFEEFRVRLESIYLLEEERYREFTVELNSDDIRRYIRDKQDVDRCIDELIDNYADKNVYEWPCNGYNCMGRFGGCDYLPICSRNIEWYPDNYEANGKEPLDNYRFQSDTRLLSVMSVNNDPFTEKHEVTND